MRQAERQPEHEAVRKEEREPLAWALELDADLELAHGRPGFTPQDTLRSWSHAVRVALAPSFPTGDVILDLHDDARALGLAGRCFCPTPRSLARLGRAGAILPDAPSFEVLRRVNARAFAFALGHLDGAVCATTVLEVERALATEGRWLLKRAFGFAGRGQRRIDVGREAPIGEADRAWIEASLRIGELVIEPRVSIELEVGLHGLLGPDGAIERGRATVQDVDSAGQWRGSRVASPGELTDEERAALERAFEESASALRAAGYFGPFGIDAFRYDDAGTARFHRLSEINARYSMGWPIGMGGWR